MHFCPAVKEPCRHCQVECTRGEMSTHLETKCPVPCPRKCGTEVVLYRSTLKHHLDYVCMFACPNGCSPHVKLNPTDMKAHIKDVCPAEIVKCVYSKHGCKARLARHQLSFHYVSEALDHAKMVGDSEKQLADTKRIFLEWIPKETLINAVKRHALSSVIDLIDIGVDVNEKDSYGDTAIGWACYHGRSECIAPLVTAGADLNHIGDRGRRPVSEALMQSHMECVHLMIVLGCNMKFNWHEQCPLQNVDQVTRWIREMSQ